MPAKTAPFYRHAPNREQIVRSPDRTKAIARAEFGRNYVDDDQTTTTALANIRTSAVEPDNFTFVTGRKCFLNAPDYF